MKLLKIDWEKNSETFWNELNRKEEEGSEIAKIINEKIEKGFWVTEGESEKIIEFCKTIEDFEGGPSYAPQEILIEDNPEEYEIFSGLFDVKNEENGILILIWNTDENEEDLEVPSDEEILSELEKTNRDWVIDGEWFDTHEGHALRVTPKPLLK